MDIFLKNISFFFCKVQLSSLNYLESPICLPRALRRTVDVALFFATMVVMVPRQLKYSQNHLVEANRAVSIVRLDESKSDFLIKNGKWNLCNSQARLDTLFSATRAPRRIAFLSRLRNVRSRSFF